MYQSDSHRVYLGKDPLTGVKCKQRNAHTSAILPVFSKSREPISLWKSCFVAGSITFQSFPDSLESARKKASLSNFPSIEDLSKSIEITHKLALHQNHVSLIFDSEEFKGKAKVD